MKWVTRARARVDRIACPWLIARFIDDKYRLTDPALESLALIVRGADTDDRELAPEAWGLYAVASGFREVSRDDFENMDRQFPVYDALYAYCRGRLARGA